MNSTLTPEVIKARVILGVQYLTLTRYLDLSATVALLWDFADTFGRERRHFWGGRWSWLRILFFLNRYFAIVIQLFNTSTMFSPAVSPGLYVAPQCLD
ncbi:hypothetical protein EXIGLDRAFT_759062 [Exidia glandulosa HHB12029]|uniref:DUF6533 domain-containing protein n=1 Tax=Exidia glandulosa HHB12029 TaxID=1314781 RepID=A0A165Q6X9_EXIGL|nr:hypothetical protein EXIGLDRAFT_759062 [Exidia glandulosa HHB12029]